MAQDKSTGFNEYTIPVLLANVKALTALGVTHVRLLRCPECNMPCLAESWHSSFVCGYCGGGAYQANESGECTYIGGDPDRDTVNGNKG